MLKKLFFLCTCTAPLLLGTNGNIQKVVNEYEKQNSKLARKLDEENVWRILKKDQEKADDLALQTLFNFYSADVMYGNMEGEELLNAWEEIKKERLEEERKIQEQKKLDAWEKNRQERRKQEIKLQEQEKEDLHPLTQLRTKQPSERKYKRETSGKFRKEVMEKQQAKTTDKYFGQAE